MSVRSVWKGSLKIGLVMVPCKMIAATDAADKVRFNQLHDKCRGRIQSKTWCPTCNEEVSRDELLRGYEIRKGEYVTIDDGELDAVADEESSMLEVTVVSDDASIEPTRIDSTLYLVPNEKGTQQAFETLRLALGDRLAIGNVVIRKKSCLVALQSVDGAFVVYRLRSAEQVRSFDDIAAELPPMTAKPDPVELKMARQLIDGLEGSFSYEEVEDEYTTRLRALIEAKDAGQAVTVPPKKKTNVTSLADALALSLAAVKPKPIKASAAKPKTAAPVKKLRKTA